MNEELHSATRIEGDASILVIRSAPRSIAFRVCLPVAVLVGVAIAQMVLAKTTLLSPWKGGGFGMFATNDGLASRYIRIFVDRPGGLEELAIAPSQDFAARRAQLFPSDRRMSDLARTIVARERRYSRDVRQVTLEVWRTEYTPGSIEASDRLLRQFQWHVATGVHKSEM